MLQMAQMLQFDAKIFGYCDFIVRIDENCYALLDSLALFSICVVAKGLICCIVPFRL